MIELVAPLTAMGFAVEPLRRGDAKRLFAAWCEAFCCAVKLRTGRYRHGSYHWHAFSFELVKALGERKALDQYLALQPEAVVVIPESWKKDGPGVRLAGLPLPDLTFLRADLYVFPESMDWSMAFTHEQPEIGPYFTWRDWCRFAG